MYRHLSSDWQDICIRLKTEKNNQIDIGPVNVERGFFWTSSE